VGSAKTSSSGLATVTWSSSVAGVWDLEVRYAGSATHQDALGTATLTVVDAAPTSLTLSAPKSAVYKTSVALSATLTSGRTAVSGETVTFSQVTGAGVLTSLCTVLTNDSGVATCTAALTEGTPVGTASFVATYGGRENPQPALAPTTSPVRSVSITRRATVLQDYVGTGTRSITLFEADSGDSTGEDIGGQTLTVEFLTSRGKVITGSAYTWTVTTDPVTGVADLTPPAGYMQPPGAFSIRVRFTGSLNYAATTFTQPL
jgi:hypothetical protein